MPVGRPYHPEVRERGVSSGACRAWSRGERRGAPGQQQVGEGVGGINTPTFLSLGLSLEPVPSVGQTQLEGRHKSVQSISLSKLEGRRKNGFCGMTAVCVWGGVGVGEGQRK